MSFFTTLCPRKFLRCAIGLCIGIGIVSFMAVQAALLLTEEEGADKSVNFRQVALPTDEASFRRFSDEAAADQSVYAMVEPAAGDSKDGADGKDAPLPPY
jgi:hypothetical protein